MASLDTGTAIEPRVAVIVPARDEAETIVELVRRVPLPAGQVTVADNGSRDGTGTLARAAGARVVHVADRGYGRACRAGVRANEDADILVFLDADLSERPEDLPALVGPIARGQADLVLGARSGGARPWHARAGTQLCVGLINALWGGRYTDLGPYRAIRRSALEALDMRDETWGWTIEMQVRALEAGLRVLEVPVRSGPRAGGRSKISGTIGGTIRAAARMLGIIVHLRLTRGRRPVSSMVRVDGE
jgi:glycosyltransferase involved in cell wall biosynthesis